MLFSKLTSPEKQPFVKTKIVATIGPASRELEIVRNLIIAGVDVFRLNFSHGNYDEHASALQAIRQASEELSQPVAVMQDLCGPKMRLTAMENNTNIQLPTNSIIEIAYGDLPSLNTKLYLKIIDPTTVLKRGERVLLHDGTIELIVEDVKSDSVICKVTEGGEVRSHAGIAFPDSDMNLPATTEKDLKDLEWGLQHDIDYVAVSFVQNAADITRLREIAQNAGKELRFIPKIERRVALECIDEILDVSDGVLVARGDLGVEIPVEKVPGIQRMLIRKGNKRGIPVIVATEMLQSMITESRPTRAEVTDITFAVGLGADAVMLSGETAIGRHPIACVEYMRSIAYEIEQHYDSKAHRSFVSNAGSTTVPDALAFAAVGAAERINADLLIAPTCSGATARLLAKYRPEQVITAVSDDKRTLQRMALYRGVDPILGEQVSLSDPDSYQRLFALLKEKGQLKAGSIAVVTGGLSAKSGTSEMHVCKVD